MEGEQPQLGDLLTSVIKYLQTGMILQVGQQPFRIFTVDHSTRRRSVAGKTLPPPQVRVEGASDLAWSSFQDCHIQCRDEQPRMPGYQLWRFTGKSSCMFDASINLTCIFWKPGDGSSAPYSRYSQLQIAPFQAPARNYTCTPTRDPFFFIAHISY